MKKYEIQVNLNGAWENPFCFNIRASSEKEAIEKINKHTVLAGGKAMVDGFNIRAIEVK